MNKNNICIVSPSLKMGGIERALVVLANYFSEEGYKVTFISCLKGNVFYKLNSNIQLIEPEVERKGGIINAAAFYPSILNFIRKNVKKVNPDTVLAFGDLFSPLVLFALAGTKYPVFISDRTSPDYNFKFPIPILKKIFYPKSAGFIAQTQKAANYKQKQFNNKLNIKVIPNAIRIINTYPNIKKENIILFVGRFAWEKRPELLINAFANIKDKKDWELHMAGAGPMLKPMKELAQQLNIEKQVVFHGKVENVDELYAKASIFVLPSVLEGFPNSLCEAMAAGLPSICYNSIPHEDILTNGYDGIVIENGNTSNLTDALTLLQNDKKTRETLGNNAKAITDRLNVKTIGNQILNFIFSV